jgi:hypothetical protein
MERVKLTEEDQVRAVIENIAESFSKLDFTAWLENFHAQPMVLTHDACMSPTDSADAETLMNPIAESMRARGFTRTSIDACTVKLLSPTSSLASVAFTRFAGEEVLERIGATYVLQKREGRWGVLLVAAHGPDLPVLAT